LALEFRLQPKISLANQSNLREGRLKAGRTTGQHFLIDPECWQQSRKISQKLKLILHF
jgi:hypothetical protein